jgi:hypothetical protein
MSGPGGVSEALRSSGDVRSPRIGIWLGLLALSGFFTWSWNAFWLAPLRLLVVLFHELGHALAVWISGGQVVRMVLDVHGGGRTEFSGGWPLLVLNAGYLGSLLAGLGLLWAADPAPRVAMVALGVALIGCGAYMPFSLGLVFTGIVGFLTIGLGWSAPVAVCAWGLRGIGVFSVAYALVDAREDAGLGDAAMLAQRTGLPAVFWTAAWIVSGLVVLVVAARRAR